MCVAEYAHDSREARSRARSLLRSLATTLALELVRDPGPKHELDSDRKLYLMPYSGFHMHTSDCPSAPTLPCRHLSPPTK